MRLRNLKKLGFAAVLCLVVALSSLSNTWASGSMNLMGAATYSLPDGSPLPTSGWGLPGGGLVLTFGLSRYLQLELGGFYLTRLYTFSQEVTTRYIEGQLGFRYVLGRTFLINFGGYGNYYFTDPNYYAENDLGVYAGLGLRFPLSQKVSFLINPQYHYAINKLTYSGGTISQHEILLTAGFSFGRSSSK